MSLPTGFVILTFVTLLVPLWADNNHLLNRCHEQCRGENELKASCRAELHCDDLLPNVDAFVRCMGPCKDLGANCFQRCAFHTDQITNHCLRQCGLSVVRNDDSVGHGVAAASNEPQQETSDGNGGSDDGKSRSVFAGGRRIGVSSSMCYRACYDEMLNLAMDRLYRKGPES